MKAQVPWSRSQSFVRPPPADTWGFMDDSKFLGPVIKAWFKANDWPQSVSEGLARAKGWEIGPWASQISICMSGRLQPKPPFFVALGMFNQAIAERDFVGVTDRRLMDRLCAGQPIVHDGCCPERSCAAGVPWNAMDFFGCYIGVVSPPEFAAPKPEITEEQVDHFVPKPCAMDSESCASRP